MTSPAPSGDAHAEAVMYALDTYSSSTLGVYRAQGPPIRNGDPDGFLPYVIVHAGAGVLEGAPFDPARDLLFEFQISAIGSTPQQAAWGADQARAVLFAHQPLVASRTISPVWQVDAPPVQRDDTFSPPLYLAAVVYQLRSSPA